MSGAGTVAGGAVVGANASASPTNALPKQGSSGSLQQPQQQQQPSNANSTASVPVPNNTRSRPSSNSTGPLASSPTNPSTMANVNNARQPAATNTNSTSSAKPPSPQQSLPQQPQPPQASQLPRSSITAVASPQLRSQPPTQPPAQQLGGGGTVQTTPKQQNVPNPAIPPQPSLPVAAVNKPAKNDDKKDDTNSNPGSASSAALSSSGSAAPKKTGGRYRTFILAEAIFEVEQRYEIKEIVGHGAYGNVCSARDLKNNSMMAVKKIENIFEHRSLAKRTLRELKFTRLFFHENIMGVDRVMWPRTPAFNDINMVSELMETDLACVIRSPQELTDEHCQFFIYQVLRGLKYIHSASVVHRDLKPRNLLVNSNCDLKICDFGLARLDVNDDRCVLSTYVMTRWYRAPEVILAAKRYNKSVDMWAVGCILAELLGRKPLFPGRDSFHQMSLIVSVLGTPSPNESSSKKSRSYVASLPKKVKIPFTKLFPKASPLACDLLEKLLQFDPDKRLTVEQALRHPYLEELHCEEDEPICDVLDPVDFEFEYLKLSKDELRGLIHQEIVNNYKEEDFEPPNPQPVETLTAAMLKALPKGKRRRRKSF